MSLSGWVMMALCVGGSTLFFAWSLTRVLRVDRASTLHSDADRPPDLDETDPSGKPPRAKR
jgi:hypothetical protein